MPLNNLNSEQLEAARADFGKNLIIASAGTGKTSTIVGRIAHLLNSGVNANEIMLLTFTNKAAGEMISRLERYFSKNILSQIKAGTFHSIAYRYLKHKHNITLKQDRELKTLLKSIYESRNLSQISPNAPYKSDYLYDIYSLFLNSFEGNFGEFLAQFYSDQVDFSAAFSDIMEEFSALKKEHNYFSFDDLLLFYKDEITSDSFEFCEILVDEYQDTNRLQNSIILSTKSKSLFCVGDYDQSIYAFNGSDINIIAEFGTKFSDARIFSLNKNYRSSGKILNLANKVIEKNKRIYPKKLEVMCDVEDSTINLLQFGELKEQYNQIAKHALKQACALESIAIIFRNNQSGDYMEAALRQNGINCRKKGAKSFFESKEIMLFIDLLNLFYNPKDMMAFVNVLSACDGLGEGISKDIYEALINLGGDIKNGFLHPNKHIKPYKNKARNAQLGLFDDVFILEDSARFDKFLKSDFRGHLLLSHPRMNQKGAESLQKFYEIFKTKSSNLGALIDFILASDLFKHLKSNIAKSRIKAKFKIVDSTKMQEYEEQIDKKIEVLINLSKKDNDLGAFLNSLSINGTESSSGEGIHLLTIHASKGLEFECVYIIDLMDGRFPNTKLISKSGSLEEERRLFYVAATRAKRNLFLSYALRDEAKRQTFKPSIFLIECGAIK